jgi:hypothetical protein
MQKETKEIFQSYKINPITGENEFLLEIKHNNHPVRRVTGTSETVKGAAAASPRMIITQTHPRRSTEIIDSNDVFGYIKKLLDAEEEEVLEVEVEPRSTKKIKIRATKSKKSKSKSKSKSVSR